MEGNGEQPAARDIRDLSLEELWAVADAEIPPHKYKTLNVAKLRGSEMEKQAQTLIHIILGFREAQRVRVYGTASTGKALPVNGTPEQRAYGFDRAGRALEDMHPDAIASYAKDHGVSVEEGRRMLKAKLAEHFTPDAF